MAHEWLVFVSAPASAGSVKRKPVEVAVAGPLFVTVTVKPKSRPAWPGLGETVWATDTSASVAATTFKVACAACESCPLAAVTLRVLPPVGVPAEVEMVRADDCGFASVMLTDAGWKLGDAPDGRPVTPSVTWPVKPLSGVTVTLYVVPPPCVKVRDGGVAVTEKSGAGGWKVAAEKVK